MDQNRPKTRGLEASEAEEDAKVVKAALKDPVKLNLKKIQQKLKSDYGGGDEESDSEDEAKLFYQQPPFDDEEDGEGKSGRGVKRKRSNLKKKSQPSFATTGTGVEEEIRRPSVSARLTAILREELKPKIVPYNLSTIEYKQVRYRIGDIVSIQKEETKYYAQIMGFHTDQFCGRYASIRWLIPDFSVADNLTQSSSNQLDLGSFRTYINAEDPIHLNCCQFVARPPAWCSQQDNPNTIRRRNYYIYNNEVRYLDTPSATLTSAEKRY